MSGGQMFIWLIIVVCAAVIAWLLLNDRRPL